MAKRSVSVERSVVFGKANSGSGQELLCDVFKPAADVAGFADLPNGLRAGILVVHGGGWVGGDKDQLASYALRMANAGYVCVCNSYRLASGTKDRIDSSGFAAEKGKWPSMIHDCKAAVRWMRANSVTLGISPDHIAVTGNSAGGHLSLMVAGTGDLYPELEGDSGTPGVSSKVQACGAVYPPTIVSRHKGKDSVARGLANMVGKVIIDDSTPRDMAMFSPMTFASAEFPPTCFLHGNGDTLVSAQDSFKMYEELNSRGAHAEIHMFASAPHAFDADPAIGKQCANILILFFDRIFRPEKFVFKIHMGSPGDSLIEMDGNPRVKSEARL